MARLSTDFSELSLGVGLPAGYSNPYSSDHVTYEVVADETSPGGKAIDITMTGTDKPILAYNAAAGNNQSGLILYEPGPGSSLSLVIHGGGGFSTEDGYFLVLDEPSNSVQIWRGTGGSFSAQGSSASFTLTPGNKYWVRLSRHVVNSTFELRIWAHGTFEPSSWLLSSTNAVHTGGFCGVSEDGGIGASCRIHYMSFGTDYDDGCEVLDGDFPDEGVYVTTNTDQSIRVITDDGLVNFVVRCFGPQQGIAGGVEWHKTKEKLYVCLQAFDGIKRYNKFGTEEEVIETGVNACTGVTFDYENNEMYYTQRIGISGQLYKNHEDGGSHIAIVSNINWPGRPFFNSDDGLIYVPYDFAVRSYNSSGVLQVTYPTDTNDIAHCVLVDSVNVMVGYWNDFNMFYIPIGTTAGPWINADSRANIWNMCFDQDDKTIVYGCALNVDSLYKWTGLPPVVSGNRTTIMNSSIYLDAVHSVTHFRISTPMIGDPSGNSERRTLGISMGLRL